MNLCTLLVMLVLLQEIIEGRTKGKVFRGRNTMYTEWPCITSKVSGSERAAEDREGWRAINIGECHRPAIQQTTRKKTRQVILVCQVAKNLGT